MINPAKISNRQIKRRQGQTLVEYALILAFISVVAIGVLIALGNGIKGTYSSISSSLASAQASH
jgi:pilus assembly protein Flp/PilA